MNKIFSCLRIADQRCAKQHSVLLSEGSVGDIAICTLRAALFDTFKGTAI